MRKSKLFSEMDVDDELKERAFELTSMLVVRDMLVKIANESEDMSVGRLDKEIAMIEKRLTKCIH